MPAVTLYDTTLRDGAQMEGISLSVADKLRILARLDELGIHFAEGGWPGSNPKDDEFFRRARELPLQHTQLVAFGSTRRAHSRVEQDPNLQALLDSRAPVITLVGKSWDKQVRTVLETSLEENLDMVQESIAHLRGQGRRVIFDAEHFFDGYKENRDYALASVRVAADAGAEYVVLCDTNGGSLPQEVAEIVGQVRQQLSVPLGIHCHNDADVAVANSFAAVQAGVTQVQGTLNGYGERCGNANLLSIIGGLKLKMGIDVVSNAQLSRLTEIHRFASEMVNLPPNRYQAYVGESAFSHKGGLHASAMTRDETSYQHVDPARVGNAKRIVVSELAGRGSIAVKLEEHGLSAQVPQERLGELLNEVKEKEKQGLQYEGAEASFDLLVRRALPGYKAPFALMDLLVVMQMHHQDSIEAEEAVSEAIVKVCVGEQVMHTVAEGNGPVNALDRALRKALRQVYPQLDRVHLTDYKVRIVASSDEGTDAVVRVLLESSDGERHWSTVGASGNIIEASWQALADGMEYALLAA